MAGTHEPLSINVGSKLLLIAILLMVFGVMATILLPVMTAFAPAAPGSPGGPEAIVGAIFPGIGLLVAGILVGVIAGIFLGYAQKKYPNA
jgi:ABC-type phosphate transport system permease subunit